MLALFLLLVIVAIALGIVGVVVKGLVYLLIIGIVVFLGALLLGALRIRRRPGKPARLSLANLRYAQMVMTRTALVTGGASGLGAATAVRLRAEGLTVTTLDVSGSADVVADVTDEAALRLAAGQIGPVDVLINSAGIVGANKPLLETTAEEWRRVFEVNVLGTVNTMRIFVPGMRERGWGRVVNFASMAGKDGNPNLSPYSASKAAVIALTKSAGKELALTGVLVNAIAPAVIATPMNDSTAPDVLAHITSLILSLIHI